MRKTMLLLGVLAFVSTLWAQDPKMGTWKVNLAKSKISASDAANLKESKVVFREIDANTIEGISTDIMKDGKTNTTKWTVPKNGGIQKYQQGGPEAGISIISAVIDPHTLYSIYLLDGKQVFLLRVIYSKDFKTFTLTGKGTDAQGKPVDYMSFSEKQ